MSARGTRAHWTPRTSRALRPCGRAARGPCTGWPRPQRRGSRGHVPRLEAGNRLHVSAAGSWLRSQLHAQRRVSSRPRPRGVARCAPRPPRSPPAPCRPRPRENRPLVSSPKVMERDTSRTARPRRPHINAATSAGHTGSSAREPNSAHTATPGRSSLCRVHLGWALLHGDTVLLIAMASFHFQPRCVGETGRAASLEGAWTLKPPPAPAGGCAGPTQRHAARTLCP